MNVYLPGIYCIKDIQSGQCYIGSSRHLAKRLKDHLTFLANHTHINRKLQSLWDQHGPSIFRFSILEIVENKQMLPERELYWIKELHAQVDGFNIRTDLFKGRTHMHVGVELHLELEQLGLGSMDATLKKLIDHYKDQHPLV